MSEDISAPVSSTATMHQSLSVRAGADTAREFEAVFISSMLDTMMPKQSGLFGQGSASPIIRSMFTDSVAQVLAFADPLHMSGMLGRSVPAPVDSDSRLTGL